MKRNIRFISLLMMTIILAGCLAGCGSKSTKVGVDDEVAQVRTTTCTRCDGSGVCYHCDGECYRDGRRCRVCDGSGVCPTCLGAGNREVLEIDGQDYVYCANCHGSGECTSCSTATEWSSCIICNGSGVCRICHGKGVTKLSGF